MDTVRIQITSPVKIGEKIYRPGDFADVDPETAASLEAGRVVTIGGPQPAAATASVVISKTADEIDQLVADRARILSETLIGAVVEQALEEITRERDTALVRADAAEARLLALDAEARERAASSPTDNAAPAVKAQKKGAAAPKG